jgi:glycosyltransferase involved in cell wall biosynthesis
MTGDCSKYLILIPAYNAADSLVELTRRIREAVEDADVLIINDGSTDDTDAVLKKLDVLYLTNESNRGKGYTLQRGFEYAIRNGYDYVVTIDADLQHLPEEIQRFIDSEIMADIYMGTRDLRSTDMPIHRRLTNYLTSLIISIFSGRRIRDTQSGYRMLSTDVLKKLKIRSIKYDFESELLFQAGMLDVNVAEVRISTVYEGSRSYINPLVDTLRFIKLIWRRIVL